MASARTGLSETGRSSRPESQAESKAAFAAMFDNVMADLVPGGKEKNAMFKGQSDTERRAQERRRRRITRRNGGEPPAISKQELLARRKWKRNNEALQAAGLSWFEGGGKPSPAKVDPDPTRTHLLPSKFRNPAKTRSELFARRAKEDHKLAASLAPAKEHSIHPVNIPKLAAQLGSAVGWWQEDKHDAFRGLDRGLGTRTWGRDDGQNKLNETLVDGCFNHADAREVAISEVNQKARATTWGKALQFPLQEINMIPLLDDEGNMVQRSSRAGGGTPRLPTPKMHRRRVRVQDGLVREPQDLVDPLRTRAIQKREIEEKRRRKLGVSQKITETLQRPNTGPVRRRGVARGFTDSVLAFGPMTKEPARFPKPKYLDEFGKSMVVTAEELAPVPSDFSATSASWRLTKSFGDGPNPKPDTNYDDDASDTARPVFGTSVVLATDEQRSSSNRNSTPRVEFSDRPPRTPQPLARRAHNNGGGRLRIREPAKESSFDALFSPLVQRPSTSGSYFSQRSAASPSNGDGDDYVRGEGPFAGGSRWFTDNPQALGVGKRKWEPPNRRAAVRRKQLSRAQRAAPQGLRLTAGLASSGSVPDLGGVSIASRDRPQTPQRRQRDAAHGAGDGSDGAAATAAAATPARPQSSASASALFGGAAKWAPAQRLGSSRSVRTGSSLGVSRW